MRTARFNRLRWVTVAVAMLLLPGAAYAGLVEVTATLTDRDTLLNAFSATATVVAGTEFTGNFPATSDSAQSNWSLDFSATGFVLSATCADLIILGCDFPQGLSLSLSGMVFSPPASLIGLTGPPSGPPLLDGSPQVTPPSSILINFQSFQIGSGGSDVAHFAATFQTEPLTEVPEPGTGLLVLLGGLGLAILGLRRARH